MSLRLLALKEDPANAKALAAAVRAMGHTIKIVPSRKEAIEELNHTEYDAIISALHLSKESAYDFLRVVKATDSLRDKPFIFCCVKPSNITRTMFEGLDVAARALGADALLLVEHYDDPRLKAILADFEKRVESSRKRRS